MIITGAKICAENAVYENGVVEIVDGKISKVLSEAIAIDHVSAGKIYNLPANWLVFPGMIDLHMHGAYGSDVMDIELQPYVNIGKKLPQEGVTAYLATTMTQSKDEITTSLRHTKDYCQQQKRGVGAELLGVNLEGPFISQEKSGAQPQEYILSPNLALLKMWREIAGDWLRIITFAPEIKGNDELIKYAVKQGIIASIGHSCATYEDVCNAFVLGCNHITHLFNALPPIHHRQPGPVLAALLDEHVYVELIADGIHLHPAILQLVLRLKGAEKIILVTDAISAKGLPSGDYKLAGQNVHVANGQALGKNGMLAGSVLTMDQALRNILKFTGCSLLEASKMLAQNAARHLGLAASKGSIAPGKDADIVILDENYNVMLTFCCGEVNYIADKMKKM